MTDWGEQFKAIVKRYDCSASHDLGHMMRVAKWAAVFAEEEGANMDVVLPAAWLHDLIDVPKDSLDRNKASLFSAQAAIKELEAINYPKEHLDGIFHAIHAHSFSANVPCETLEAKVVQDADRLEALGVIGMIRTFSVGGSLGRELFDAQDPTCRHRAPDDGVYSVDHFFVKLFKLPEMLHTDAAKHEAQKRVDFMHRFLTELEREAC